MRKEFRDLISLEKARELIITHLPLAHEEDLLLESALGKVLAEKIISKVNVPGFDRASMDGYAVHAIDTFEAREDRAISLKLTGQVQMGALSNIEVSNGEAAEVSTGSAMPLGADAVAMIEYSQVEGDQVLIRKPVHKGENVQTACSDVSIGETLLFPGTRLTARQLGVMAAIGRDRVKVRCLRVGVASTGNELAKPGTVLRPGQIYDINSYSIAAAAEECGATVITYGILPDEKESLSKVITKMASECSLILVSGSTSAGEGDMIYQILPKVGKTIFHGINLKPGKPTIFGVIKDKPFLGLPGYPTSALTVFRELAAPAIKRALGLKSGELKMKGRLGMPIRSEGRQEMLAVGVWRDQVYPVDKGSGSITTLANADGFIEIPAEVEYMERGELADVSLFGELEAVDIVVAGENSLLIEKLAETLPLRMKLLTRSSAYGRIYVEEGVADVACISRSLKPSSKITVIKRYTRDIGWIFRNADVLQDLDRRRIVGWHADTAMKILFEEALKKLGIPDPKYEYLVRTHSAVAAAVNSGRVDLGFGEQEAAIQAGLDFQAIAKNEIQFIVMSANLNDSAIKLFISALHKA